MEAPRIVFNGVRRAEGLEKDIRDRAGKLERYFAPITSCRVTLARVGRRHRAGNHFHVAIAIVVPQDTILVQHEPADRSRARRLEQETLRKTEEFAPDHKFLKVAIR